MQNLKSRPKLSCQFVVLPRGKFRNLSRPNRWNKQESEPGTASDVSSRASEKEPRQTSNGQNNKGRDAPASIESARAPGACQHKERRNQREEKKNMIQIHDDEIFKI